MNFTQPAITCSKLTIETLERGVKYVQSAIGVVLASLLFTLNIQYLTRVSIVKLEQVNAGCKTAMIIYSIYDVAWET